MGNQSGTKSFMHQIPLIISAIGAIGLTFGEGTAGFAQEIELKAVSAQDASEMIRSGLAAKTGIDRQIDLDQKLVGQPAPDFVLKTIDAAGKSGTVSLEALKGKVVVLEFWATWCAPCVKAIPHINELQEKLGDDFVFIAITSEEPDQILNFLKQKPMSAIIACAPTGEVHENYGVCAIPASFIIDKKGTVVGATSPLFVSHESLAEVASGEPFVPNRLVNPAMGEVVALEVVNAKMQPPEQEVRKLSKEEQAVADELASLLGILAANEKKNFRVTTERKASPERGFGNIIVVDAEVGSVGKSFEGAFFFGKFRDGAIIAESESEFPGFRLYDDGDRAAVDVRFDVNHAIDIKNMASTLPLISNWEEWRRYASNALSISKSNEAGKTIYSCEVSSRLLRDYPTGDGPSAQFSPVPLKVLLTCESNGENIERLTTTIVFSDPMAAIRRQAMGRMGGALEVDENEVPAADGDAWVYTFTPVGDEPSSELQLFVEKVLKHRR